MENSISHDPYNGGILEVTYPCRFGKMGDGPVTRRVPAVSARLANMISMWSEQNCQQTILHMRKITQ